MKQLQRDDGPITEDVGEMRDIATQFYSNLLSAQCFTINQLETPQCVWQTMHAWVSLHMTTILVKPTSIFEVKAALDAISSHVCPGIDGLSPDFFWNDWEFIGNDINIAFQEVFDTGSMPSKWIEGMIYLIPKLEGVVATYYYIVKLGFPNQWLTAVSALYNLATSRVLVAGDLGQTCSISRSVRQGCL